MAGRVPARPAVRRERRPADHGPGVGAAPDRNVPGAGAPDQRRQLLLQPHQGVLLSAVRRRRQVPEGDQGPEAPGRPARRCLPAPRALWPAQPEAVRRARPGLRVAREVIPAADVDTTHRGPIPVHPFLSKSNSSFLYLNISLSLTLALF